MLGLKRVLLVKELFLEILILLVGLSNQQISRCTNMNTKYISLITAALLAISAIAGIASTSKASTPITITDDLGRTVTITSSERIVSIGPSCTEILYALGLGDKIVGVDIYSDYPPEAVAKQKISNWWMPNPEEVAALNPDLVFYAVGLEGSVQQLESLGLTVVALNPKTMEDIFKSIKLVGDATSKSAEAKALVSAMRQTINKIQNITKNVENKPRVYIEFWYPPPMTFGNISWGHQLIELAGGINVFGNVSLEWFSTTDEDILETNPEIIISLYGTMHYATLEDMKQRPGWNTISAVKNGKVYLFDENLFLRTGPRIVEGLKVLSKALHPEFFGEVTLSTFAINTVMLKTETRTLTLMGPIKANIVLIKAANNGTLSLAASKLGPKVPANLRLLGEHYLDIDSSVPIGLAFILRIYYTDKQLQKQGINEESLCIYKWDAAKNKWIPLNCFVNKDENYVETIVLQLSYFALMGEPETPIWAKPVPLWLVSATTLLAVALIGAGTYMAMKKRLKRADNE
jgi:iron complex transport system substrate-binding protein